MAKTDILITFATREGQSEKIARTLAQHLKDRGLSVVLHDAQHPFDSDLSQFGFLLFGGSMHAGGIEKELVNFINANADAIQRRPNAFFLVLLSAATKDPILREESLSDARQKMKAQIHFTFDHVEMFAGALMYSKYSWPMKMIMKRIAKKAGGDTDTSKDYEYTDWKQVEKLAEYISDQVEHAT